MNEEPELIERLDGLKAWDVAEPPEDFGDRVLAAYDEAEAEPVATQSAAKPSAENSRRRIGWLAVAAAVVVGAAAVATLVPRPAADPFGSVVAEQQQTVRIGERATVVADAGATLSWSTADDGTVVVEQPRGSAFYRVDSGEPFAVHTPAGNVRVTGTCFSVDVEKSDSMMNTRTKAAAVGAAVAVAVTVTVYEGSTVLANEAGTLDVGPGQRAVAEVGGAPRLQSADDDARIPDHAPPQRDQVAALRAETHRQAAEIAALSNELAKARGDVTDGVPDSEAQPARFAPMGPPIPEGFDHYQPTDEALQQMAECGVVAWDQPPVWADDQQLDPEYLAALGLPEADAAAMQEVFEQFRADTVAQAREFYVELGGKPELAETIDPSELLGLVYGRTDFDGREAGRVAIAMERAGLAEAPTGELSPTESFLRWDAELGNRFEAALAERFGAERAQQLRAERGGWSGKRTTWADLCLD